FAGPHRARNAGKLALGLVRKTQADQNAGKLALGLVRKTQADQNAGKLALGLVRKTQADHRGRSPRLKWPEEIRQVTPVSLSKVL
ncbi:hypothetical protein, partial [Burkholderia gladioli]|uniref:hypothetical protein n=1 Tax=Burkholderia gladioli TaxID=28095 RepID=UPI001ABADB59